MPYTITPNMNLTNPLVGTETGPQYATDIYNSLNLVDSHNHTTGMGVQIPPGGLNINASLTFQGNAATNLLMTQFSPQMTTFPSSVVGALYESGVDLYYNDGAGNVIRLTRGGSIVGTAGSITGLPAGSAGVAYSSPTYTFQSAAGVAGDLDAGSITIRQPIASANGITIESPTSLAANYALILPTGLPSATSVMTLDSSGNIAASTMTFAGSNLTLPGALIADGVIQIGGSGGPSIVDAGGNIQVSSSTLVVGSGGLTLTSSSGNNLLIPNALLLTGPIVWGGGSGPTLSGSGSNLISDATYFYPSSSSEAYLVASTSDTPGANSVSIGSSTSGNAYSIVVGGSQNGTPTPLKMVRGIVLGGGTVGGGEAFSVVHTATGVYTVTFAAIFADVPSVVANVPHIFDESTDLPICSVTTTSTSGFQIRTYNLQNNTNTDYGFNFIAIGLRDS